MKKPTTPKTTDKKNRPLREIDKKALEQVSGGSGVNPLYQA